MDTDDFTIKTIRDGAVCTLILHGELDFSGASGFLQHVARAEPDTAPR